MDEKKFVIDYIAENGVVDILNSDFVNAYIQAFDPPRKEVLWGACKVPKLGRLLGSMYREKTLTRGRVGIPGGDGFPTWVYCYDIP